MSSKARDPWTVESEKELKERDGRAPFVLKVHDKYNNRILYPTVLAIGGEEGFKTSYKGDNRYELLEYWRTSIYD